jgi:hypothetical protein
VEYSLVRFKVLEGYLCVGLVFGFLLALDFGFFRILSMNPGSRSVSVDEEEWENDDDDDDDDESDDNRLVGLD